jgi:hypothetical protein
MKKDGLVDKYWICNDCADKRDLVCHKTGNTRMQGRCGHCESEDETFLTPIVDFVRKKK